MTSEIKNRKSKQQRSETSFKPAQFINHALTEGDKAQFKRWASEFLARVSELLDKLVDDGYSVSVKPDAYTGGTAAFLSTTDEKSKNFGYVLSGRASSSSMALLAVLYRHYVLFEGDWPVDVTRPSNLDDE